MTPEQKHQLAYRCAIVAGLFVVVVSAMLLANYSRRVADDPLNSTEYLALMEQLDKDGSREDLKQEIRKLDVSLREAYFSQRRFAPWGAWLLLGGMVICLVSAISAVTLRRGLPHPEPRSGSDDADELTGRVSRWAVAAFGCVIVVSAMGLYAAMGSALPNETELATLLESERPNVGPIDNGDDSETLPSKDKDAPDGHETPKPQPKDNGNEPGDGTKTSAPKENGGESPSPDLPTDFPSDEEIQKNWHRFRGPGGSGVANFTNIPTKWDGESGEGILWKTTVPLPGNGSPVVWDKRVFVSGADEGKSEVYCFDADSGEQLWSAEVPGAPESTAEPPEVGETTGFAACTPTTDGRRVYAMFANGDIGAVDFDGNVAWSRSLGVPKNIYGHAASLAMYQGLVIIQFDQGSRDDELSKLLALHGETGDTVWEAARDIPNSWSSPIVIRHEGQTQIITGGDPWLIAYSPTDGKEIWRAECLEADVGPSPVYADGIIHTANEFPGNTAVRVEGTGNVTETNIVWESDIGAPDCASPLATDKFLMLTASYGTLTCFDVKEGGEPFWEEDFDDANFTSSPSLVGKYVYLFGEEGKAWIVEPTRDECKRIAEANLGEGCVTSPAFQDGRLYIRGEEHLFCIADG
ncbi:MAG: PQQ-like beta-propeller repeat protein [Planctomycetes bacterium]|nr:PQQ-like beta-propeller repeat protein [Planctomycetota bacterium]MBL7037444.1 PQQ-like beta-propeller repeat protein [Pirellulaceae bacterium]